MSPAEVWGFISSSGYLEECHPFCAANPVEQWPGNGSRDAIEYLNGRVVGRTFTAWLEGLGYDIEVADDNGPLADVSWRISQRGETAELTIGLDPHTFRDVPQGLRWIPQLFIVRPMLRRYLRSVLRGVRWRLETGTAVARNQFGRHMWFS